MATNQTPNFGLSLWEPDDPVLREEFNANHAAIDAALASCGNCCIATGSYIGTGTVGSASPCQLQLGFKPLVFFLNTTSGLSDNRHTVWLYPEESPTHISASYVVYHVSWLDEGISWYITSTNSNYRTAEYQYNTEGTEYYYTAIGFYS